MCSGLQEIRFMDMKPVLQVKNLTKDFNGFRAIDKVSFGAGQGEIFGLLGPNGAGKTTTIRVIATTLAASSGTAQVAGFDIQKEPVKVRANIGVLTADIGVYHRFSGRENLVYFGRLYGLDDETIKKRISYLVKILDMGDFIDRKAGKYSTGMKQKLALARSVIHNPQVMIFDEPTSGLDVLASQTILNFMRQESTQGKCIILSTHEMADAERLCDRVAIIHQGKVVANDTVTSLQQMTQTDNLEDTFLALIKAKHLKITTQQQNKKQIKMRKIVSKNTWRILRIVSLLVMFAGFALRAFEINNALGLAMIVLGLGASIIIQRFIKKQKL